MVENDPSEYVFYFWKLKKKKKLWFLIGIKKKNI